MNRKENSDQLDGNEILLDLKDLIQKNEPGTLEDYISTYLNEGTPEGNENIKNLKEALKNASDDSDEFLQNLASNQETQNLVSQLREKVTLQEPKPKEPETQQEQPVEDYQKKFNELLVQIAVEREQLDSERKAFEAEQAAAKKAEADKAEAVRKAKVEADRKAAEEAEKAKILLTTDDVKAGYLRVTDSVGTGMEAMTNRAKKGFEWKKLDTAKFDDKAQYGSIRRTAWKLWANSVNYTKGFFGGAIGTVEGSTKGFWSFLFPPKKIEEKKDEE